MASLQRIVLVGARARGCASSLQLAAALDGGEVVELGGDISNEALSEAERGVDRVAVVVGVGVDGVGEARARTLLRGLARSTAAGVLCAGLSGSALRAWSRSGLVDECMFCEASEAQMFVSWDALGAHAARRLAYEKWRVLSDAFLQVSADLLIVMNAEGRYLEAESDPGSRSDFVRVPEDLVGRRVHDVFPRDVADEIVETIRDALESGERRDLCYSALIEGEMRWFRGMASRFGPPGTDRVIWVARDITSEHETAETLANTQRFLERTFDLLPMGVFWKDVDSRYLGANAACLESFGVATAEGLVGHTDDELQQARPFAEKYRADDLEVMRSGESRLHYLEEFGPEGPGRQIVESSKIPMTDHEGEVVGVIGVFRDVTEEQQLKASLEQANAMMSDAQALVGIGTWVYDLKTEEVIWSDEFAALHGLDPADAPLHHECVRRFYADPRDQARMDQTVRNAMTRGTAERVECWLTAVDGVRRRVRHVVRLVGDHALVGLAQDITMDSRYEVFDRATASLGTTPPAAVGEWTYTLDPPSVSWDAMVSDILAVDHGAPQTLELARAFFLKADGVKHRAAFAKCMIDGTPYSSDSRIHAHDGSYKVVHVSVQPRRDADERIVGAQGTVQDVTMRHLRASESARYEGILRKAAELSGVGGWYFRVDTRTLEPTDRFLEVFGYPKGGVLSRSEVASLLGADFDLIRDLLRRCIVSSEKFTVDLTMRRLDGEELHCVVSGEPHMENGRNVGVYGALIDATAERKRIAAAEWTTHLLEQTTSVVGLGGWHYAVDEDRVDFTRTMDGIARTGSEQFHTLEQLLGHVIEEDARAALANQVQACLTEGEAIDIELGLRRFDGEAYVAQVTGVPKRVDGRTVEVFGSIRDITEERARVAQEQAFEVRVQHAQKLESLGVLSGGIAHDFNNLLVSVVGFSSIALSLAGEDSAIGENVTSAIAAAQKAADLTKQLLAYSGKGQFVVEPVRVDKLMREMGQILRVALPKGVRFSERYGQDVPNVQADRTQLTQVFLNLITNAGEAIGDAAGTVSVRVESIDASQDYLLGFPLQDELTPGAYVRLEVSDNGLGMSPETATRIFEPFFTTKFTGRGLGLAAVQGIVRGHSGAIRVKTELGEGTTFEVLLPAIDRATSSPPRRAPRLSSVDGCVLVVDDEPSIRKIAKIILERAGMCAETANDGQEAIDAFRANPDKYSVVLLDMTMPRVTGLEAFRVMKEIRPDVRVVLCSGYSEEDATSGFSSDGSSPGLAGFLQKPYLPDQLVASMQAALSYEMGDVSR